jgi:putative addiction module component (TIGR02574 family)
MAAFDDILGAAQSLPPSDQIRLIGALWDTIPVEQSLAPSSEWIDEVQHRSAEYEAGRMPAAPWPEVRERARRQAGLDG